MQTILVPIDGSDAALRALQTAIHFAQQQKGSSTLHVLNVQPPLASNNAARFFTQDVLTAYYDDAGQEALHNAKKQLDLLDIPHQTHVSVGPIAEVIEQYIAQHQCDHVVMGTRGLGAVPGLLLGSVTSKVLSVATVPVTLVK